MQNAVDLGVFYRCEDLACMLHIFSLRAQISQNVKYWGGHFQISQNVKYWYEICDVLVPIFHAL